MGSIINSIKWQNGVIMYNNQVYLNLSELDATAQTLAFYKHLGLSYPKFYKMDLPSKVAYLCAELIVQKAQDAAITWHEDKVAMLCSTATGSLDVDEKYLATCETIPSPALFVYTLPNIMLGEVCIRHKFKGEQLCTIAAKIQTEFSYHYIQDLFANRQQDFCLVAEVAAYQQHIDAKMALIAKEKLPNSSNFSFEYFNAIFN